MTKLIALLAGGIPAIIAAFLEFLSRKMGVAGATIASGILLTAAMIACINEILNNVLAVLTVPPFIANAVGMFMPGTFTLCLSAIISARVCRVAYNIAMWKVEQLNNAN